MKTIKNGDRTVALGFRGNAETLKKIEALQSRWGPVVPIGVSDVIRVCIDRAHDAEFFKKSDKK